MSDSSASDPAPPVQARYRFEQVSKSFAGVRVLSDFSAEFADGRIYSLLGLSGSGKSTILKLMLRLLEPDGGSLSYDGRPLASLDPLGLRRDVGYVLQGGGLFPHLTAAENVSLVARYLNWPAQRIANRIEELSTLVALTPALLSRRPHALSGGQQQRVALMRALMLDPHVLLLDEPLGALDPITRRELQLELKPLFQRLHKLVLLVTHDVTEAAFFSDEVLLLDHGSVVQRGAWPQLRDAPATEFVRSFLRTQQPLTEAG